MMSLLIDLFAVLILMTAFLLIAVRQIRTAITVYTVQAALLAGTALAVAIYASEVHIYVAAGLTVLLKVLLIPRLMRWSAKRTKVVVEPESGPPVLVNFLIAAGLVGLSFVIMEPVRTLLPDAVLAGDAVTAGMSLLLIGFFLMIIRRKALSQVIGLMTLENGLFLAAISATHGMPLIVEIGIFFDVFVGATILAALSLQLKQAFDTTDMAAMKVLSEKPRGRAE